MTSFWIELMGGTVGGVVGITVVYPLDTVKCRKRGAQEGDRLTPTEMFLAGGWSGLANSPLRQVFERVKSVMQVRQTMAGAAPYSWSGACALDLVRKEGLEMGLLRGMGATMIREPLQFAVYYPVYEAAKSYLLDHGDGWGRGGRKLEPVYALLLAGGIAGCATWLPPIYCIDVVKTRMQTADPGTYAGMWDCAVKIQRGMLDPACNSAPC